jgi:hypothetical protein
MVHMFSKKGTILPAVLACLVVLLLGGLQLFSQTSSQVGPSIIAPSSVSLKSAASFAVLGGSTVTNTGPSIIKGDLGVNPGCAITGFPPGTVVGGATHKCDAVALQAQNDNTAAYNVLAGLVCSVDETGHDLGGLTLTAGVYCFTSSAQLTGTLTLNAQGNPNALFIFQIASTLTTASESSVQMINGGNNCNAYWQVGSSATLGTTTSFLGNILALTSISLDTGASVSGRALAQTGAVTMDSNEVSISSCSSSTTTTSTSASQTSTSTISSTTTCVPITPSIFLSINARNTTGSILNGFYADIWSQPCNNQASVLSAAGFIPVQFHVVSNQIFAVGAYDYGCYRFDHWSDTGSTARFRNILITSNTTLTAVYQNICQPLQKGYSSINVNTIDSSGGPLHGYYTTLWQNGTMLQSCFSDCSFSVGAGTYQVGVSNFGGSIFDHWTDGVKTASHTVVVGSSSSVISLTAVYAVSAV